MKSLRYLIFLLAFPLFGQATSGAHRVNQVISRGNSGLTAQVVPGAHVYVTLTSSGAAASIYYDPGLSFAIPGSVVTTDTNGNYNYYYALNVCLTETTSAPGQGSIVTPNICSNGGSSTPGITALTGDVTASGTGSVVATVTQLNGAPIPTNAACIGTTSSGQLFSTSCSGGTGAFLLAPSGTQTLLMPSGYGTVDNLTNTNDTVNGGLNMFTDTYYNYAPGWDLGGIYGWFTGKVVDTTYRAAQAGIAQWGGVSMTHMGKGDTAVSYDYLTSFGSNTTYSDEAVTAKVTHTNQVGYTSGVLNSGTAGATTLNFSGFTCNAYCTALGGYDFAVGGLLLDVTQPQGTLTVGSIADTAPGPLAAYAYTLSSGTVTPSTAWGTVLSCPTQTQSGHYGVYTTQVCNITLVSGTFVSGTDICYTGHATEEVLLTSVGAPSGGVQQITTSASSGGGAQFPFNAGDLVMQGGPCGQSFASSSQAYSFTGTTTVGSPTITGISGTDIAQLSVGEKLFGSGVAGQYIQSISASSITMYNNATASGTTVIGAVGWPEAWWVVGATNSTTLLFANCLTGVCYGNAGANLIVPNTTTVSSVTAARASGTVTATWSTGSPTTWAVGSPVVVSSCSDGDLDGTFAVVTNSMNGYSPSLTWAQSGSTETGTGCVLSVPLPQITLYPSAWINGTANGSTTSTNVSTNSVNWTSGDSIIGAPATQYQQAGIELYQGQLSEVTGSNKSIGLYIDDVGPKQMLHNILLENTPANGVAQDAINITGSYSSVISLNYAPANNGTVLYIGRNNVNGGTNPTPYWIFRDNTGAQGLLDDWPGNRYIFSNNLYVGTYQNASEVCTTTNGVCRLTGTTGSIGGSSLSAGTCASGTASVTGATVGHPVDVSATDGSAPNPLTTLTAQVTSTTTITVQVCAISTVTPTAKSYNVTSY